MSLPVDESGVSFGEREDTERVLQSGDSKEEEEDSVSITTPPQGSSWWVSSLIVVNAALGAGILNFPWAFDKAGGLVVSMSSQLILVIFSAGSMLILGWCADLRGNDSYQETITTFCGKVGGRFCSVSVCLYMYGTSITYLTVAGDQSDKLFQAFYGDDFDDYFYMNRKFVIPLLSLVLVWPFCYTKRIDFLKYASVVATVSIFYIVGLSVYVYTITDTSQVIIKTKPDVWSDVFAVIPAICFAYQCHVSIIPVYSCIAPHNLCSFSKTLTGALVICLIAYSVVGIFGYLTFGAGVQPDVLSSYDPSNGFVAVGFVLFAIKNFMTVPILLFCGRLAVESMLLDVCGGGGGGEGVGVGGGRWGGVGTEVRRRVLIITLWFFSALFLSVFVPSISDVIDFLGCLAALFIFFFPGLCLWKAVLMFETTLPQWQIAVGFLIAAFFLVFGALLFGMTFVQGIQKLL